SSPSPLGGEISSPSPLGRGRVRGSAAGPALTPPLPQGEGADRGSRQSPHCRPPGLNPVAAVPPLPATGSKPVRRRPRLARDPVPAAPSAAPPLPATGSKPVRGSPGIASNRFKGDHGSPGIAGNRFKRGSRQSRHCQQPVKNRFAAVQALPATGSKGITAVPA